MQHAQRKDGLNKEPQLMTNKATVKKVGRMYHVTYTQKKRQSIAKFENESAAHEFALAVQEFLKPTDIKITDFEFES